MAQQQVRSEGKEEQFSSERPDSEEAFEQIKREIRSSFAQIVDIARHTAEERFEELKNSKNGTAQSIEERVRENPLQSLLIASVLGFVLGLFLRND